MSFEDKYIKQLAEYNIIMADPPWPYQNQATRAATGNHYASMSLNDIKALPVGRLAALPCALFLWVTWPNIQMAFEVIDAWGFEYKTLAWDWWKTNLAGDKFIMGLGNYSRSNPEPCLLAFKKVRTRGRIMKVADRAVKAWIIAPRGKHSQKPNQQYDNINRLYPDMPKLELFARQVWPGWDAWGDELEGSVDLWP